MSDYLLAIDNGTQSVRALIFDPRGHLIDKAQVQLDGYFSAQPGWVEHHPEAFWQAACQACQRLWANAKVPKAAIAGVTVTTQRGTVINLDAQGQPLRPAMIWLDQRRVDTVPEVAWWWKAAFKLIGMEHTLKYFQREAEANWIAQNQPELWKQTRHYLLLSGYLNYRLCGRMVDSIGSQVGFIPFDYKSQRWAPRHDWKWQAMPLDPDWLPELLPPGTVVGEISAQAAAESGIPAGLPLVLSAADKACEVLGAGALTPDTACLSYGTAATINTTTRKYVEATRFIPPYPAAVPGHYSTEIQITRGYWMVSWFKEQFGHHEQRRAEELGVIPEALFDELVNTVPPGSMGLMLQPFWNPGIKVPGPEAKGAVIGFGDVHTRAHFYRAILEGLAYALREGKERVERASGDPISRVRVAGGGSQSDAAMQLTADIFGLPAERPHLYEASGLGAALVTAVGLKLHPDFATAVKEMTRVGRVFEPNLQAQATYDALYRDVYCKMYQRLAPLYREIQRITGYPKLD